MILKVVKQKQIDNGKQGETSLITEYYESKTFEQKDGFMFDENDKPIDISGYTIPDDITHEFINFVVCDVYLMNNDGKTIERLK